MEVKFIFKSFWLILILVGLLNYLLMRLRIKKNFTDPADIDGANRFLILSLFYINMPFLIIGVLQIFGGHDNIFFIFSGQYQNSYVLLSWVVMVLVWGLLLYWVLVKDGAKIISKYRVLFNNMPENETMIKIIIVLMVLGGIAALTIGNMTDFYHGLRTINP